LHCPIWSQGRSSEGARHTKYQSFFSDEIRIEDAQLLGSSILLLKVQLRTHTDYEFLPYGQVSYLILKPESVQKKCNRKKKRVFRLYSRGVSTRSYLTYYCQGHEKSKKNHNSSADHTCVIQTLNQVL